MPTQRATPVSAANASSNRATAGPLTNAPVSISSARSWRISADNDACVSREIHEGDSHAASVIGSVRTPTAPSRVDGRGQYSESEPALRAHAPALLNRSTESGHRTTAKATRASTSPSHPLPANNA